MWHYNFNFPAGNVRWHTHVNVITFCSTLIHSEINLGFQNRRCGDFHWTVYLQIFAALSSQNRKSRKIWPGNHDKVGLLEIRTLRTKIIQNKRIVLRKKYFVKKCLTIDEWLKTSSRVLWIKYFTIVYKLQFCQKSAFIIIYKHMIPTNDSNGIVIKTIAII